MIFLSVYCDEFRGRAHAQPSGKETRADGPGLRFGDTEPGGQKAGTCERYQTSDWSVIEKYGDLSSSAWLRDRPDVSLSFGDAEPRRHR